jgi:hypothetical protein
MVGSPKRPEDSTTADMMSREGTGTDSGASGGATGGERLGLSNPVTS